MHNTKAFTLIELLIVIAIIGILAGVVLVSTSAGRGKAKDAAIMSTANSMMKAIQAESIATGNYSNYDKGWIIVTTPCSGLPSSSLVNACNDMIAKIGDVGVPWDTRYKLYIGKGKPVTDPPPPGPAFSIMVALPEAQKFYCIGSNGGSSSSTPLTSEGCGGSWFCSGCYADPAGGGN